MPHDHTILKFKLKSKYIRYLQSMFYFREKLVTSQKIIDSNFKLPLVVGLSASLGTDYRDSAMAQIFTLCANMDCKSISFVSSEADRQNLAENIPSPLEDKLVRVMPGANLTSLQARIETLSLDIMRLAKIEIGSRIGQSPYENSLYDIKKMSETNKLRDRIVACKYLIELNLIYARVQHFSIKYCLKKLAKFIEKINTLAHPEPIEVECRIKLKSLFDFISQNSEQFQNNVKLEKMVKIILNCHKTNSRG